MSDYDLTYLSLGAGVQSSALLVCSALGLHGVPKVDFAVFADTHDEPAWVYDTLAALKAFAAQYDIPVETVTAGRLSERFDWEGGLMIPLFVKKKGTGESVPLRRTCTERYKVRPIERFVRERLGCPVGSGVTPQSKGMNVRALIGISLDEVGRMKVSDKDWIVRDYPLAFAGLRRGDCLQIIRDAGLEEPKRSACVYCPYHSDTFWYDLKTNYPEEWARAVEADNTLRTTQRVKLEGQPYLHRSLLPLPEVDLSAQSDQGDLFGNECEGMCGV